MASKDHIAVEIPKEEAALDKPVGFTVNDDDAQAWLADYNEAFFHRVVEDAGRWAFGVIFAEVWVLNQSKTHLWRPDNGWWIEKYAEEMKFEPLTNPDHPDYLAPEPLPPQVGLPGILWFEASQVRSMGSSSQFAHGDPLTNHVLWRAVKPIADDPDQPHNPRLKYLAECGLGLAAGVPFKVGINEGIVIYMARSNADTTKLQAKVNEEYLKHATLLIGSAFSLRMPRRGVVKTRHSEVQATWKRVKNKVKAIEAMEGMTLAQYIEEQSHRPQANQTSELTDTTENGKGSCADMVTSMVNRGKMCAEKSKGAQVNPPPTFDWLQTAWTFAGAFITLSILTNINKALLTNHGSDFAIVLGPFGALVTLQYGLTAAPASQPRNAIVGQTLSLFIAYGIGKIEGMELWLKMSLATSLAVSVMVKFGFTHPPAGAAALLFSNGSRTLEQVGMMLVGNVVAIACATLINNANEKRQYPTFWGLRRVHDMIFPEPEKKDKVHQA